MVTLCDACRMVALLLLSLLDLNIKPEPEERSHLNNEIEFLKTLGLIPEIVNELRQGLFRFAGQRDL